MNLLYLHGLNSRLSPEKRTILENYGQIFAPDIDYSKKYIQPETILNAYKSTEFDVVIGSSMGALNAYIISENIGRPALLFNPPLSRYQKVTFTTYFTKNEAPKQFLLGAKDEVVNPTETLAFLANRLKEDSLRLNVDSQLEHRIPVSIFTEQLSEFFNQFLP